MAKLTVDLLAEWSKSECGGVIVSFTPATFRTVVYFLREFAVSTADPYDELGAFQSGDYLVVGKKRFRDELIKELFLKPRP